MSFKRTLNSASGDAKRFSGKASETAVAKMIELDGCIVWNAHCPQYSIWLDALGYI